MYDLITCYCGNPQIGLYYDVFTLMRIINFSNKIEQIEEIITDIFSNFKNDEDKQRVQKFILTSINHFEIFQNLNKQKSVQDFINQYNNIYPYEEMIIEQKLSTQILQIKKFCELFGHIYNIQINQSSMKYKRNIIYEFLQKAQINKICCKNAILTNTDFYNSKNTLSQLQ